ncbi:MAG: protein kinase [Gemmatimonadaceae bacterium]|nr:protein kinase [Gemmatimonadaceae bacterium]
MTKTCVMCGQTAPDSAMFCPRDGSVLRATVVGDDLIGELFCERYVVTDVLGAGGMGTVYLARDVRLPQQVAIKVLRDQANADPAVVQRFRQEAEAASRINHDRVARVTDFGFMADGRAYLVMEYVSGRSLKELLDERETLTFSETAQITSMVAEGLNAAHRLGIVHRDLKPENVMIVDDPDGDMRVKVLDFGIAKVLDGASNDRTAPGFVIGTPKWMSPEQLLGAPLDGRSDVYALALLAFAMLTGVRAFQGASEGVSEQAEMMARLSIAPRTLAEARPEVAWSDDLQALFRRTLVRDPEARPATTLAFARELQRLLEPATTVAHVAVATPAVATPAVAHPATAHPATATSPIIAPSLNTPSAQPVASVATLSNERPRRRSIAAPVVIGGAVLAASIAAVMLLKRDREASGTAAQPETIATPMVQTTPRADSNVSTRSDSVDARVGTRDTVSGGASDTTTPAAVAPPPRAGASQTVAGTAPSGAATARNETKTAKPANTPSRAPANADASAELERLISEAEQSIGDEGAQRVRASTLIRRLQVLLPKLTASDDRGWALFYIGTSHATLGAAEKACSALQEARGLATTSRALKASAEKLISELGCS